MLEAESQGPGISQVTLDCIVRAQLRDSACARLPHLFVPTRDRHCEMLDCHESWLYDDDDDDYDCHFYFRSMIK